MRLLFSHLSDPLLQYKANSSSLFLISDLPSAQGFFTLINALKCQVFSFLDFYIFFLEQEPQFLYSINDWHMMLSYPMFYSFLSCPIVKIVIQSQAKKMFFLDKKNNIFLSTCSQDLKLLKKTSTKGLKNKSVSGQFNIVTCHESSSMFLF